MDNATELPLDRATLPPVCERLEPAVKRMLPPTPTSVIKTERSAEEEPRLFPVSNWTLPEAATADAPELHEI